jgi:hypothetical protein
MDKWKKWQKEISSMIFQDQTFKNGNRNGLSK